MICLIGRSDILSLLSVRLGSCDVCRATNDSGFYEFGIQVDGPLVADENATGLEHRVPGQAVVFAVDLSCCRDCNSSVAPGVLRRRGWPFHGKDHLARDTPNGQVTLDGQLSVPD